jgi:hypothetical protein
LQLERCDFEQIKIEYLGIIISFNKVEMDPVKITGVIDQQGYSHLLALWISIVASSMASPTMYMHCLVSPWRTLGWTGACPRKAPSWSSRNFLYWPLS